jgi:hypothetical protein
MSPSVSSTQIDVQLGKSKCLVGFDHRPTHR